MVNEQHDSTEEKIRAVAKELFSKQGYNGTTIREVAEQAGVNIALLNYYFRSKDKLFLSIFSDSFTKFLNIGKTILLDESIDFLDRIPRFIDEVTALFQENPQLPIFVLSECNHNPDVNSMLADIKAQSKKDLMHQLDKVLQAEYEKGNIRKISALHLDFLLGSQIILPFLTLPILKQVHHLEGKKLDGFLKEIKEISKEMIVTYLKSGRS